MTDQPPSLASLSSALADLAAATAGHIVEVQSRRSLASGFFWRPNLVITPDETLAEEGEVLIERADGTVLPAERLGRDPSTDIALLQVAGARGVPVGFAAGPVRVGALALAIGAAESAPLVAFGIVGAVGSAWQSMRGGMIDARLELDVRLRQRAQGGLAVAADGTAFGMAVRGARGRALVIPAATIDRVAAQLLEHGRVPRPYLGAGLRDVPLDGGAIGAMAMTIDAQGPVAAAGIHQGDVIVAWKGAEVRGVSALLRALRNEAVGAPIEIEVRRGGALIQFTVTIGDRPPE